MFYFFKQLIVSGIVSTGRKKKQICHRKFLDLFKVITKINMLHTLMYLYCSYLSSVFLCKRFVCDAYLFDTFYSTLYSDHDFEENVI